MPRPDASPAWWAVAGVPLGLDEDSDVFPLRAADRWPASVALLGGGP